MHTIEPYYGWLGLYTNEGDENSPFAYVEHSEFHYTNRVYNYMAHPLWDDFGSESLLLKILYANYDQGYAIIELFGVWNDLLENDFRLMRENCLDYLQEAGIDRFIFICENVLSVYPDQDDYYADFEDNLEEGWMALIRPREHVCEDLSAAGLDNYLFWSPRLDELSWRKLKPWKLLEAVESMIGRALPFVTD